MQNTTKPGRGFVTMATGKDMYYRLAETLLLSYRLTTANPLRFAILCDRENKYTEAFDDVILLENPRNSYVDKLELLVRAPYEETIFIDADCIAYTDLNEYWNYFENTTDLSCFGTVLPLDNTKSAWFTLAGAGRYADQLSYLLEFHGGIYFIRRGDICEEIYRISKDVIEHYSEFTFKIFDQPADEPAIAVGMALCGCKPVKRERRQYAFYSLTSFKKVDFFKKICVYDRLTKGMQGQEGHVDDGMIIHFGARHTISPLYTIEAAKVHFLNRHGRPWSIVEGFAFKFRAYAEYILRISWRGLKRKLRKIRRSLLK